MRQALGRQTSHGCACVHESLANYSPNTTDGQVYGRDLLIYDMDVFTRGWLKENAGVTDKELAPIAVDFDMGPKRPPLQVPHA